VTVACVKIIGAVLVGALLVIPAASARIVSSSLRGFVTLSIIFALVATIAGIVLPMEMDLPVPSGAAIILAAGCLFIACATIRALAPSLRGESL
jgi:zinc transport system permease protein